MYMNKRVTSVDLASSSITPGLRLHSLEKQVFVCFCFNFCFDWLWFFVLWFFVWFWRKCLFHVTIRNFKVCASVTCYRGLKVVISLSCHLAAGVQALKYVCPITQERLLASGAVHRTLLLFNGWFMHSKSALKGKSVQVPAPTTL